MIGKTLSHYRILDELGRGGMGIVYKAEDTKLDRTVAIKVLPSAALASEDDRARFYREAKAAAQLHHPNIASVFEIDEAVPEGGDAAEPRPFIAMEFIEGETLYETIKKGPFKLADAVNVTAQIAEALKAAHAKDIVHRDIKSANVMMTPDGIAKVLDFGLAKTNQSTMLTRLGSTLGTMAYMSPEQARGQEVDGRTDLYSLGTMLYEMVSGRPPFSGDYEQAVVYSLLNEPPEPLTSVRTGVPMQLEWIVNKLLAKDADYRYQTAADLLADLKSVDLSGSGMSRRSMPAVAAAPSAQATTSRIPIWMWGAIAGVAIVAAGAAWMLKPAPAAEERTVVRFDLELESTLNRTGRRSVAISPDGRTLAYVAMDGIRVRRLGSLAASSLVIPGNDGRELFFSPDSRWLGYEETENDWLMKVEVVGGGAPTRIAALPSSLYGASWSSTGDIFLGFGSNGMGRVADTGGVVDIFADADTSGRRYHRPSLLPDGKTIIYSTSTGSWDEADIFVRVLDSGDERLIHSGGTDARYVSTGHLVYLWKSSLYAMPFDAAHGQPLGGPVPVAQEVASAGSVTGSGQFDISGDGTLVALHGTGMMDGQRLEWISPDGSSEPVSPDLRNWSEPTISPDGSKVAVEVALDGENDIWIVDATLGTPVRFTSNGNSYAPVWSPDGRRMAYSEADFASPSASLILARDTSDPTRIDTLHSDEIAFPESWTADERHLALTTGTREANDIFVLDLETGQSQPFQDTDADTEDAAFSADGRWLAFESDESASPHIYVRLFPEGGNRVLVSEDMGWQPVWSPDGRRIYYGTQGGLRVSEFDPETGIVQPSREVPGPPGILSFLGFSVHPDGRILVIRSASGTSGETESSNHAVLDFVINFDAELRARAPADS